MNNMKKTLLSSALLLAHLNTAEAIIFGDEQAMTEAKSQQRQGTYPTFVSASGMSQKKTMATATLFKTPDGAYYGLTNAHSLVHLPTEIIGVQTGVEKIRMTTMRVDIPQLHPITNCTPHPLYNPSNSWEEQSQYDTGIFSLKKKGLERLSFFEGGIYNEDLIPQTVYPITLTSYGPVFDSDLTSYQASGDSYHETPLEIIYSEKGFFYRNVKSRHFYVSFSLNEKEGIEWFCDLLPEKGDVGSINGDSGGLALTLKGEAIALQRGRSWSEFYANNRELAQFIKNLKSTFKDSISQASLNPQESLNLLLTQIHQEIADEQFTKQLKTENGLTLYRFTLQNKYPDLVATDYFTPLSPYKDNINRFIEDYRWNTQPLLKKSELYTNLGDSLRLLKEKELKRRHNEIDQKYITILEMANILKVLEEKRSQNIPFTEKDQETISNLGNDLSNLQGVQVELSNFVELKSALDKIRQENLDTLDWFYKNKNKLKEENPILTDEEQGFLRRVEELSLMIKSVIS